MKIKLITNTSSFSSKKAARTPQSSVHLSWLLFILHKTCSSTITVNSNLNLIQHYVQWLQAVPEQGSHAQPWLLTAGVQAMIFICETIYMTWAIWHFNDLAGRFLLELWKWAFWRVVTAAQEQLLLRAIGKRLFCRLASFQWGPLFNLQGSCRKHKSYWGLADLVKATCGNF